MEKKIRKRAENLSNEELELEFLTTRLRLTQLDDERTRRIRRSTVNSGRDTSRATSPRKLLGKNPRTRKPRKYNYTNSK